MISDERIKVELLLIRWKIKEFLTETIVRKLVRYFPNKVKYWIVIDVWARATTDQFSNKTPDEITWTMALGTLEDKK
jgi:hypothetical protein